MAWEPFEIADRTGEPLSDDDRGIILRALETAIRSSDISLERLLTVAQHIGLKHQLCLSNSAIWSGSDWAFEAGRGSRARAAFERLALVSPVETIMRRLPSSAALLSSVP